METVKSPYLIAEIGQAHEGSLGIAHSYIDALADSGVDAIKFQTHIAKAESSFQEPFRTRFSFEDKTRFDYWKRMEFSASQWLGLKEHCEEKGLQFISSPFSIAAVDLLEDINCPIYKIGSGEVTNLLLLDRVIETGKPIILSSGMSSYEELDQAVSYIKQMGDNELSLLQCTTAYPCPPGDWGIEMIQKLKSRYNLKVGFSDHSGDIYAGLAAAAVGANVIEFHVVFDKRMFGPDAQASLEIDQVVRLSEGVRAVSIDIQTYQDQKSDNSRFNELKGIFEKSLAVNKDKPAGTILRKEDLESKKPAHMGIPANKYNEVIGTKLTKSLKQWDFVTKEDINE